MNPFQTTLIIGLGGVGSKVVEGIYRRFNASNPTESDRRNVAFLCLDTDAGDINERKQHLPENSLVKTSSDLSSTVGGYIERIQNTTDVREWFDTRSRQLKNLSLNEGAAQIRMASRLAYMSAISEGKMTAIDNSIRSLLTVDPERHPGNEIKVHIVCSLAGGTGAGSFLQVAYYVKDALRREEVNAPKITGYFMLAGPLCHDSNIGLSKGQKENCRSNTYACIKEQVAFSSSNLDEALYPLNFQYRLDQRDKALPPDAPYDYCYLVDYTGSEGGNLRLERRYEQQIAHFLYLNAFSPIGDEYRSRAINNMRQEVESNGMKRYAAMGVSRLIYPVDDLFAYFAHRKVMDNLSTTWLRIDREIDEEKADYRRKINEGLPAPEPVVGDSFRQKVEHIAKNGNGREQMEFRRIYNSTQLLDEEMVSQGSKARAWLDETNHYIRNVIANAKNINKLRENCKTALSVDFVEDKEVSNTRTDITENERALKAFYGGINQFVDTMSRAVVKECLAVNIRDEGYVARDLVHAKHQLNTYILEPDGHELHPVAARYLLYDAASLIESRIEVLKRENKDLLQQIDAYATLYDDPSTDDRIEGPLDHIREESWWQVFTARFTGRETMKKFKDRYKDGTQTQIENLSTYCEAKLKEEVYVRLLSQIGMLIKQSESFFANLPHTIEKIREKADLLLRRHDGDDDPSVQYVLASVENKEALYDEITRSADPFFPTEMSAAIYRTMYETVVNELEQDSSAARRTNSEARRRHQIEATQRVVSQCIESQDVLLRKETPRYANLCVMDALKEEAERATGETGEVDAVCDYMEKKFKSFRDRAQLWGASSLDESVQHINAWGMHPACDPASEMPGGSTISKDLANRLFGDTDVAAKPTTAASRMVSTFYRPSEIERVNAATLLTIDGNFSGLTAHDRTNLVGERTGEYLAAYTEVMNRMKRAESETISPHLDKRWHLPVYMPNIGQSWSKINEQMVQALAYGLLTGRLNTVEEGGAHYWNYSSRSASRLIKDVDGKPIRVDKTQGAAVANLFLRGLAANPDIVEDIQRHIAKEWQKAIESWRDTDLEGKDPQVLMRTNPIVKRILDIRFNTLSCSEGKDNNWFTLFDVPRGTRLHEVLWLRGNIMAGFFGKFFDRLIEVFGASENTYRLCEYVTSQIKDKATLTTAEQQLSNKVDNNEFCPQ